MGAVTAILFASQKENEGRLAGVILDSPFSCFKTMVNDIVRNKVNVPGCLINSILHFLMKTVKDKTKVSLNKLKPIDLVK